MSGGGGAAGIMTWICMPVHVGVWWINKLTKLDAARKHESSSRNKILIYVAGHARIAVNCAAAGASSGCAGGGGVGTGVGVLSLSLSLYSPTIYTLATTVLYCHCYCYLLFSLLTVWLRCESLYCQCHRRQHGAWITSLCYDIKTYATDRYLWRRTGPREHFFPHRRYILSILWFFLLNYPYRVQ